MMRSCTTRRSVLPVLLLAVLMTGLLPALLILGAAAPASAHATLVSTDPAEGAVLATAPEQVTFTFNESVIGNPAGIKVFDATGAIVASTPSVRDSQLVVALDEEVGDGTLVVVWRLVSADGHPIGGSLSFSVGTASEVVDVQVAEAETDIEAPVLLGVLRWVGYLGLLVAAGLAAFSVLFLPPGADASRARLRTAARIAAAVAVFGWWAAVPLVALYQLGLSASALSDGATWASLAPAEYGVPAAVVVGLGLAVVARRPLPVLLGCAVALAAPAFTGHTRATAPTALVIGVDVLHLAAGALWLGGLLALSLVLGDLAARDDGGALVLSRFSTWAAGILGVLVVAGSVLAWRITGSWSALLETSYGTFLLVKVLLVLAAVSVAAWNRYALLPRLRAAPRRRERRDAAALVVRTTVAEAGVLVAVLLVTGFLVDRSPEVEVAVTSPADAGAVATQSVQLDDISAEVALDPLGVGPSTLTITMTDDTGQAAEGFAAPRLSLSTTGVDLGEVVVTNLGPGVYASDVVLPTTGAWEVQVSLRTSEFDNPVRTVEFVVP